MPLVRAAVDNWAAHGGEAALTGPIARGDEATVARQRAAVVERTPQLLAMFDTMCDVTRGLAARRTQACARHEDATGHATGTQPDTATFGDRRSGDGALVDEERARGVELRRSRHARAPAGWDGVRNYQARNFLRSMEVGDLVLFYHSSTKPPGVAGIARGGADRRRPIPPSSTRPATTTTRRSTPDAPKWDWVTVAPVRALRYVALDEIRTIPEMASSRLLARGNRLSVIPMTEDEFSAVVRCADAG